MVLKGITSKIIVIIIVIPLAAVGYLFLIRKEFQQQTQIASFEFVIENKFPKWISAWKEIMPGFDISAFKKIQEVSLSEAEYPYDPAAEQNKLREFLYVYSPDRARLIDPHAYMYLYREGGKIKPAFEPDSAVVLIDVGNKKMKQVLFCGTPCGFVDAAWVDNNTFIVIGNSEYYPPSGEERCVVNAKCTYVATLHITDLLKNTATLYYGPESETGFISYSSYLREKFPNIDFD